MSRVSAQVICLVTTLLVTAPLAYADPQTYVRVRSWVDGDRQETNTNALAAIDGIAADAFADFNVSSLWITGAETFASSAWRDEWTVTGGSGSGVLMIEWRLTGTIEVAAPASCSTCADPVTIRLRSQFLSSAVSAFGLEIAVVSHSAPGTHPVAIAGTVEVPFTYGTAFGAGLRLDGGTGDDFYGGGASFPDGAEITAVTLPSGAHLTTSSGRTYPVSQEPPDLLTNLTTAALDAGLTEAEPLLVSALSSLYEGRNQAVCGKLTAFVNLVDARTGHEVTNSQAAAFITAATTIAQAIGCR